MEIRVLDFFLLVQIYAAGTKGERRSHHSPCWDNYGTHIVDPFCVLLITNCSSAPEVDHGSHGQNYSTSLGSTVTYNCQYGYTLIGSAVITCERTSLTPPLWSTLPDCKKDVSSFTLHAYQTADKALLGNNPFTLECSYTTAVNEVLLSLKLYRKRETDSDFMQIVNFQSPSLPFNASYQDTNLESRTVATKPTEDSKTASLVFKEIECDDKAIYRWIATYSDGIERTEQKETSFVVKANTLFPQDGRLTFSPNANIEEGDNVTFSCSGDVGNEPVGHLGLFYYHLNNGTFTPVNVSSLAQTVAPVYQRNTCSYTLTSTLVLTMTKDFNNTVVRCTVQQDRFDQNGDAHIQTSTIHVYYSPKVTSIGNKTVDEGTQFLNLMCIADAYPAPMYSWVLPDGTVSDGPSYTFTDLQMRDKGTYTCVVYNTFKNMNHTVNETVYIDVLPGQRTDGFEVRKFRDYYIQAEKVDWDYLPYQQNLVDFFDEYLNDTLINGPDRVGSKYFKWVYKRYKDETFTDEIPSDPSFGYVGPLLHGEVGEIIRVHFRNMVNRNISVHPHGVRYDKLNEGALYTDNTKQQEHIDDGIQPGSNITLTWKLTSDFSPRDDDPNCIPFAYHSHVDPDREVNAGLLGLVIVCKQGILNDKHERTDVDKEFVLYFDSINEGESWLVDENLQRCQNPAECKRLFNSGDPDFEESLKKDSINGYMYGNMPGLNVCEGDKIAWYIFSLNAELHPVNIQGQTFIESHHRTSVVSIWSATFRAAEMIARNPGTWLIQCMNSEHNRNGMKVLLTVKSCYSTNVPPDQLSGKVRNFYLAAETEEWDYAPSGRNLYDGTDLTAPGSDSELYYSKSVGGKKFIGSKYKKSRFFEYRDFQYGDKINRSKSEEHLGLLGPVIRAEVGDTIQIVLINLTPKPVSIYLQGTSLVSSQNGMWLKQPFASPNQGTGHIVTPGNMGSYTFTVPWAVAPGTDDPDCLTYMYYSNYDMERDVSSGLIGPLLICKPGSLDSYSGRQKYMDREMIVYISSIDENFSWYLDDNIADYINDTVDTSDEDFVESNVMRSINGRAYGNLDGLDVCKDERVIWHTISFGQTEGNHGVTFNGNNVLIDGIYRDSHVIISGVGFSAVMKPDNVGNWSIHCHNDNHFNEGLKAIYHVNACGQPTGNFLPKNGITRRYYIAAVEKKWNYSPKTIHPLTGGNYSDPSSAQYNRIEKDGKFIGSIYTKALYREYTDGTFTQEKPITAESWHLGVLGPFIKANVGDVIEVVFKNMASRKYSMHAQGLRYNKTFEGMRYEDGTTLKVGDGVPPGSTFTYRWDVTETSGPGANGPNCINYMYHSATDLVKDTYSGLVGPIVVCRSGILSSEGKRTDSVEKEFALLFQAFDENRSWYLNQNIMENCPTADTSTDDFIESNKYDSINGLIYNNVEGLIANTGDNIAWYILGLGENEDIHTVHFHGQTYNYRTGQTHEGDVVEVFPGTYETVEMFASNPGTWLIHCHVGEHVRDGMVATYTIT